MKNLLLLSTCTTLSGLIIKLLTGVRPSIVLRLFGKSFPEPKTYTVTLSVCPCPCANIPPGANSDNDITTV